MKRSMFLALSIIFSLTGILQANPADIYTSDKVDMADFAVFADGWLAESKGNCGGLVECACGDTLVESQVMWYDIVCCGLPGGVRIGADNITLDGNAPITAKPINVNGKNIF